MAERNVLAVLFDLDGTLADTAPDMARTVNLMLERRGVAPVPLEQVRPFVSRGARGMICSAFGMTPEHPDYMPLREEFLALYADNLCIDTALFPGMAELLERLEADGLSWGVVTNKAERFAFPVMAGLGLTERAAVVVGGDTCAHPKPHPDPLLHASAVIGIAPPNALYVGDDARDIEAARAAGMPSLAAGYGYLGDGPGPDTWGADAIVQSVPEIQDWIRDRRARAAA